MLQTLGLGGAAGAVLQECSTAAEAAAVRKAYAKELCAADKTLQRLVPKGALDVAARLAHCEMVVVRMLAAVVEEGRRRATRGA